MKRRDKIILAVYGVLGVALLIAGIALDIEYYSSLMFACGFALCFNILLLFYRAWRDSRPENIEKARERQRQQSINIHDERKMYLRYKSGYIVWCVMMCACLIVSFAASLLRAETWIVITFFAAAVLQYVAATVIYKYLCRKF